MYREANGTVATRYPFTGDFLASRLRDRYAEADLDAIEALVDEGMHLPDRATLGTQGDRSPSFAAIIVEGFMFRITQRDGRRFIVSIHVPGDIMNLQGFAFDRIDHEMQAAGKVRVGRIPFDRLERTLAERHAVAGALWSGTLLDAALHRKWIQVAAQLDAPQRIAHIYCELHERLGFIGQAGPRVLRAPFTQTDLADMCGVSAVHANRAVARLREFELAEIRRGTLYTQDWDSLRRYAEFDPAYLQASHSANA
ncbi:MAG: Crp/Fnr family transcriptional regulator [Erythrobacter sp.]